MHGKTLFQCLVKVRDSRQQAHFKLIHLVWQKIPLLGTWVISGLTAAWPCYGESGLPFYLSCQEPGLGFVRRFRYLPGLAQGSVGEPRLFLGFLALVHFACELDSSVGLSYIDMMVSIALEAPDICSSAT